jgi:hypothetical protein
MNMAIRITLLLTVVIIAISLLAGSPTLAGRKYGWQEKRSEYIWRGYGRNCGWECGAIAGLGGPATIGGLYRYPYYSPPKASTNENLLGRSGMTDNQMASHPE